MNSPALLTHYERCQLAGYWSRDWEREQPDDTEMLQRAIRVGLMTDRSDHGEAAGEECYAMGATCGLQTEKFSVHDQVTHLSCLADIIATAVRRAGEAPWKLPEPVEFDNGCKWISGCYLDPSGIYLRRIALVSSWNNDRHYSECRSWYSLGEIVTYGLPMQMVVCVIGQNKGGKRTSYWTRGLRHPANRRLRFRKKNDVESGFKSSWLETWREDHDDIETKTWLQAMLEDHVLEDVLFVIDIPVPDKLARQKILDLAKKKLYRVQKLKEEPDRQMSTCDWPRVCKFRNNCHSGNPPSRKYGFIQIDSIV